MEPFFKCLDALVNMGPEAIDRFGASLPAEWIEEALASTGTASVRRRKLPAEQAVWVVLGMSLYENRSIRDVVDHLSLVAPGVTSLAASAVSQARDRLGAAPMAWLFKKVAGAWANLGGGDGYRSLALYAVDGTCVRVPDSQENFDHFGKPASRGANASGYPQLRLACLMNVGTRLLVDARFGPYATGERDLASELWASIPAKSLTILDRGFIDYANFAALVDVSRERHVLVRLREDMKPEEIEPLTDGTLRVRLLPCQVTRAKNPDLPSHIEGRLVAYQHPDGKPGRLFTTLIDPVKYPAKELIELYHERWEIELAFDELKTHMLERKESLRSRSPDRVEQELWGLLLTYNLVRREMLLVATVNDKSPTSISFTSSLMWIRNFWLMAWRTSATNIPKHLGEFHSQLNVLFLPARRSERRYPRHVKIKMSNYARNPSTRTKKAVQELN